MSRFGPSLFCWPSWPITLTLVTTVIQLRPCISFLVPIAQTFPLFTLLPTIYCQSHSFWSHCQLSLRWYTIWFVPSSSFILHLILISISSVTTYCLGSCFCFSFLLYHVAFVKEVIDLIRSCSIWIYLADLVCQLIEYSMHKPGIWRWDI